MLTTTIHPGEHLKELLKEWNISQTRLAKHTGTKVGLINEVCNGRRGISTALAQKLGRAFGTSVEFWINLQASYELGKSKIQLPFGKLPEVKAA
jgi:antitoxin HigA-1